jgi:hypothetical protein
MQDFLVFPGSYFHNSKIGSFRICNKIGWKMINIRLAKFFLYRSSSWVSKNPSFSAHFIKQSKFTLVTNAHLKNSPRKRVYFIVQGAPVGFFSERLSSGSFCSYKFMSFYLHNIHKYTVIGPFHNICLHEHA